MKYIIHSNNELKVQVYCFFPPDQGPKNASKGNPEDFPISRLQGAGMLISLDSMENVAVTKEIFESWEAVQAFIGE